MTRVWIGGALVCLTVVAAEVIDFAYYGEPSGNFLPAMETKTTAPKADALQADRASNVTDATITSLLARPLFASTRRPANAAGTNPIIQPPRLSGIIRGPVGNYAIFQPDDAPRPIVLTEGATLGLWTIRTIGAGRVTVTRGNERIELRPAFANSAALPSQPDVSSKRGRDKWGHHFQPQTFLERHS